MYASIRRYQVDSSNVDEIPVNPRQCFFVPITILIGQKKPFEAKAKNKNPVIAQIPN